MDIITACLHLTPIPGLGAAFSLLRQIWNALDRVQSMKEQLTTLTGTLAHLLQTLDREHQNGRLVPGNTAREIGNLDCLLNDVLAFVNSQANAGFLKGLLRHSESIKAIQQFHRRITSAVHAFNISALLDIQDWQARDTAARSKDRKAFHRRLSALEANQNQLAELLNAQHSSVMAMMISLQKYLDKNLTSNSREQQFIKHSLHYLSSTSQEQVHIDSWTITSFEVEFGDEIGSGGFGQVYRGTWNKTQVALKVLKAREGGIPSSVTIRNEIEMWSNLRHPHVLQFLGANIVDNKPFIVMPLLRNGNARDYIKAHPSCDRIKILRDVSLGLVYLHSQRVIHGDLKALNILIDDGHNALLCDFGLSQMKADAVSRSTDSGNAASSTFGSRNWVSPERLLGGALRKPVDIYAFGMTIYEIITTEVPLGHIPWTDFIDLVVHHDVRPERPEEEEFPSLSDDLWSIAERCWVKNPKERPDAIILCNEMELCLASHGEKKIPPPPFPKPRDRSTTRRAQPISLPEQRDRTLNMNRLISNTNVDNLVNITPLHSKTSGYRQRNVPYLYQSQPSFPQVAARPRIVFHHKHNPHYCFTNFSAHPVFYVGNRYPTSEHLYQSFKFWPHRPDLADHIRTCSESPDVAYAEAHRFKTLFRPDWRQVNISKMDEILWLKFTQHPDLAAELLATGDAELVNEGAPMEFLWGLGPDGRGRNELGKALERLRAKLRQTP